MSTAKSMATLYLNGKRNGTLASKSGTLTATSPRFKSSTSNLSQSPLRQPASSNSRLKSTSMTNLVAGQAQPTGGEQQQQVAAGRMQRPVSRNALDSIHNGMNAKYAQVQSKVYLQNIKPSLDGQQQSKIPGSKTLQQQQRDVAAPSAVAKTGSKLKGPAATGGKSSASSAAALANERTLLVAKLKVLEDELASRESERENLRQELENVKGEKVEQVQQLKLELQEKLAEHDKQNEEYHKKLLEAYELADQNRRAADSVLNESRQRDEESRKRIEQLESELNELKEFVSMKDEMVGKMQELREQLRQERERYEEQLKGLHQVFENEKISHEEEQQSLKAKHSMLLQHSSNSIKLDENSNLYFNRMKPALESSESINKPAKGGCHQCQSGSSQLHKSEQDIYGSKMSTRMQDTANRAWKASRKFASSVITGGVNLSACRQCTKRVGSQSPLPAGRKVQSQVVIGQQYSSTCSPGIGDLKPAGDNSDDQHTSVIKVGSMNLAEETAHQQLQLQRSPAPQRLRSASSRQQQPPAHDGQQSLPEDQQQQLASLIRVDENNKLTIVTKFNDSECQNSSGPETMGASSSVSERSRCESSSSGRGTSSDAGSAASQNGDDLEANNNSNIVINGARRHVQPSTGSHEIETDGPERPAKGHRRRSSLFKAGKVLGGSQASLHKLKSLFQAGSKGIRKQATNKGHNQGQQQQQQHQQVSLDHLEASRLRCMELNQAINVTSIGVSPKQQPISSSPSGHIESRDEKRGNDVTHFSLKATQEHDKDTKVEIGQGDSANKQVVDVVDDVASFRADVEEASKSDHSDATNRLNLDSSDQQHQMEQHQQQLPPAVALQVASASS